MMISVNLANLPVSLVLKIRFFDFSSIPFTNSDEPSIMANFFVFFLCFDKCLAIFLSASLTFYLRFSMIFLHFLAEPSMLQSVPFTQLIGVVRSMDTSLRES